METNVMRFMFYFTVFFGLITLLMIIFKRNSLKTGFLFNNFIMLLGFDFMLFVLSQDNTVLTIIGIIIAVLFTMVLLLGIQILLVALFWNARIVRRKEGDSFANRLTFYAGLGILFTFLGIPVIKKIVPETWWVFDVMIRSYYFIIIYFSFVFINFLSAVFLYQLLSPRKNKDYIIVLGSGLRNGKEVTPLLASRIEGALSFYHKQKKAGKDSKIIFSGGQGPDELIPEGQAMMDYAIDNGIIAKDCIAETKSTTTEENLRFSKEIMEKDSNHKAFRCAIVSNNYHVFRAAHFAQKVGLDAQGIGTPTAKYFLPNALIREFVGLIVLDPFWHKLIIIVGIVIIFLLELLMVFTKPYVL